MVFFILSLFVGFSGADSVENFSGKALRDGKWVYTENHEARYDSAGKILSAHTVYVAPNGQKIAEMNSDFRESLTAPAHDFYDVRFKQKYGIRYKDGKAIMYTDDQGKESVREVASPPQGTLQVGCQGLGYYFRYNIATLQTTSELKIKYLIPGLLETYNFKLVPQGKNSQGFDVFDVHIQNWFLRMFAPKLILHYDSVKKRLMRYEGLSNLYDDKHKQQNVEIDYTWQESSLQEKKQIE